MLIQTLTTDKFSLITSSTSALDVVAAFIDRDQTTGVVGAASKQLTAITTATTTDIVAAPAATTTRNVLTIIIRNKGAASNDVTLQFNANGTLYEIVKVTLLAGQTLEYIDGRGIVVITDTDDLEVTIATTADSTHATAATFADITGLTYPMKNGKTYSVLAHLFHHNNASTTGSQFAFNIGAAPTHAQFATIGTVTPSPTAAALCAGSTGTRDVAISVDTTGSTTVRLSIIAGSIVPSADGTFAMRATSEVTVASGLVVDRGSWMRIRRVL